jgi:hypothetical protein
MALLKRPNRVEVRLFRSLSRIKPDDRAQSVEMTAIFPAMAITA